MSHEQMETFADLPHLPDGDAAFGHRLALPAMRQRHRRCACEGRTAQSRSRNGARGRRAARPEHYGVIFQITNMPSTMLAARLSMRASCI